MSRRKIGLLILIIVFLMAAACGTVFAYMYKQTAYKDNQFITAVVSCQVEEVTDATVTEKSSIKIRNTGNIDAYLRLCLVSYWVTMNEETGNWEIAAKPSEMPEVSLAEGWIRGSNNIYYYKNPVAPEALTEELLASRMVLAEEDGYLQVVEVFAEAIQSKPANAVVDSWHVELDESGNITKVP